ncbi:hypothetical protein BDF20DRAFT_822500 [Mycotypha africana]|uniref:uncharacterized protein n=1 Tax=Mycotypha africana TaxID=64632 RepID=UPI0023004BB0|nr:uncharacterized protein BDF20DRAFT_822500 [Mycotypha africana]KAI8975122.1 hypothetical protein BDF20DRAFT_822500 [Mycotypha africana]
MPITFGGAPKCPRCAKSVYMAEQVSGPGGFWHKSCLTCKECNKRLDSTTLTEKENEAYCKTCYNRRWGPKGYGFAGGAAFLSTETKMPSETDTSYKGTLPPATPQRPTQPPSVTDSRTTPSVKQQQQQNASASSFGGYLKHHTSYTPRKFNFNQQQDICARCKKAVYAAELVLGGGNKYHKYCLKCKECGKRLDSTNMVDRDSDLYCRGCYSKAFGPKGFGYGNLLTTEGASR